MTQRVPPRVWRSAPHRRPAPHPTRLLLDHTREAGLLADDPLASWLLNGWLAGVPSRATMAGWLATHWLAGLLSLLRSDWLAGWRLKGRSCDN